MNEKLNQVPIEYIGKKQVKHDTVTGSGIVWTGTGDVQMVPIAIAQRLLVPQYADIWRIAPDAPAPALSQAPDTQKPTGTKRTQKASAPADAPPSDDAVREVIGAIDRLLNGEDAANHLDEQGNPRLESVAKVLGRAVSQAELQAAWTAIISAVPASPEGSASPKG